MNKSEEKVCHWVEFDRRVVTSHPILLPPSTLPPNTPPPFAPLPPVPPPPPPFAPLPPVPPTASCPPSGWPATCQQDNNT